MKIFYMNYFFNSIIFLNINLFIFIFYKWIIYFLVSIILYYKIIWYIQNEIKNNLIVYLLDSSNSIWRSVIRFCRCWADGFMFGEKRQRFWGRGHYGRGCCSRWRGNRGWEGHLGLACVNEWNSIVRVLEREFEVEAFGDSAEKSPWSFSRLGVSSPRGDIHYLQGEGNY